MAYEVESSRLESDGALLCLFELPVAKVWVTEFSENHPPRFSTELQVYNKLIRSHEWPYMLSARQHYVGYIPVRSGFTYGQHCGVIRHILLRYMRYPVLFGFIPSLRALFLEKGARALTLNPTIQQVRSIDTLSVVDITPSIVATINTAWNGGLPFYSLSAPNALLLPPDSVLTALHTARPKPGEKRKRDRGLISS